MSMTELQNLPVWEWPDSARAEIFQTLANKSASADDRMLAAELAYDAATNSDEGVATLADIAGDRGESIEMRGKAALAIGPAQRGMRPPRTAWLISAVQAQVSVTGRRRSSKAIICSGVCPACAASAAAMTSRP